MKKVLDYLKKNITWIIFFICVIIFIAITIDVFNKEIFKIDTYAYNFFVIYLRNDILTLVFKVLTNLGGAITLISVTLLALIFVNDKKVSISMAGNLALITVLNQVFKFIVQRPRPDGYRLISEKGYSFPSGHSMISVAFYGFIIYLICKYVKNKKLRYSLCALLGSIIVIIGCSRIYLGVHYASDVLAGAIVSCAYLIIYIKLLNRFIFNKK